MTLTELSTMTYHICVGHYINDVKRTSVADTKAYLGSMLRKDTDGFIAQLSLPDGKWFCKFTKIGSYYDLYIPDTREQENRLVSGLFSNAYNHIAKQKGE